MAKAAPKANQYDERKEGLVVERKTTFPKELAIAESSQPRLRQLLHGDPKAAGALEYIRCPTGFIRHITVAKEDVERLK